MHFFVDSLLRKHRSSSIYFELQELLWIGLYSREAMIESLTQTTIYMLLKQKFMLFLILNDYKIGSIQSSWDKKILTLGILYYPFLKSID